MNTLIHSLTDRNPLLVRARIAPTVRRPTFLAHVIAESSPKSHETLDLVARGLPLNQPGVLLGFLKRAELRHLPG